MGAIFNQMSPMRSLLKYNLDLLEIIDDEQRLMKWMGMEKWMADRPDHPGEELVKPRNSSILASRIPNSRLERLADLGHRAIWEAPEEIADLIGDFLTRPITWSQSNPAPARLGGSRR